MRRRFAIVRIRTIGVSGPEWPRISFPAREPRHARPPAGEADPPRRRRGAGAARLPQSRLRVWIRLADSIAYLDRAHWDALAGSQSFFLSRPYLEVLERHGPENLRPRYALVYRGHEPLAAVAAQIVELSADRVAACAAASPAGAPGPGLKRLLSGAVRKLKRCAIGHVRVRGIVCGNLLSWGAGVALAPGGDPTPLWQAAGEALYRIRRAEKLSGQTSFAMVKDLPVDDKAAAGVLERLSYRRVPNEPGMVLALDPGWRRFEDYLAGLQSRYRRAALRIMEECEEAGCRAECLDVAGVREHAEALHALYLQVEARATLRGVTIPPEYLPALADAAGENFRCTVIRCGNSIRGFVTTVRDGDEAVGYVLGYDREANSKMPVYFRLLQVTVADAIAMGCRRLSLGRTALEPKARLGARPVPLDIWVRHRNPLLNVLVRPLLSAVPHDEAPERSPFKALSPK